MGDFISLILDSILLMQCVGVTQESDMRSAAMMCQQGVDMIKSTPYSPPGEVPPLV